jgi:glycosyltransferase involved in cell wall biosynthesis
MKIIILTQYFPPEVGAPQNRLFELALRLKKSGADVTVLTAMPNYPHMKIQEGYKRKWLVREEMEGIKIIRSSIFVPQSKSIVPRLLNYFSFVFSSLWVGTFRLRKSDWLLCESPPLFLGISAFFLSRFKRAKLIFNVSDLWPESAEKLGLVKNRFLLRLSTWLEEFMYRKSTLITGQTQGIVNDIQKRFPKKIVYWLPNGVDTSFYNPELKKTNWRERNGFADSDLILLYAGIIGHAQGLELILQSANQLRESKRVRFILLGEGPEKAKLLEMKTKLNLDNVLFLSAVSKNEMPEIVAASDAAIVPLRKLDLFKGAIPSKIFENLAMCKPVLLGVEGEAYDLFIKEGNSGLFFEPENVDSLTDCIRKLLNNPNLAKQLGENGRRYVSEKFERDKIALGFGQLLENNASLKR